MIAFCPENVFQIHVFPKIQKLIEISDIPNIQISDLNAQVNDLRGKL